MPDPDHVTYADFIAYAESHAGKFEFVAGQIIIRASARTSGNPDGHYVGPRRGYGIDHVVPLELGGANDVRNLWPQPRAEARAKDRVEDTLHEAVCITRRIQLADAQRRIARDWINAVPRPLREAHTGPFKSSR